ncbi:MAG: tRNA (adenosine(37)-N6)-threonylcarbamoyltransferase complex transferase subunit TsaD [Opitutaceae bacterium]|nr:tRNA (adenosine(37)-N6)-threonylcarbamoyltransferase complex transferase subunit TsaD [Opitutaceae bacterium]
MILALESSCDETAVAVFDPSHGLVGEWIHTQMALHERHGGVVPDLATREHVRNFAPLLARARHEIGFDKITELAVTNGPGLAACLAIGTAAAKAMALALRVPVTGVNHLRAHAFSPFIALHREHPGDFESRLDGLLPHLGLIVSGGNTLLCTIEKDRRITVLSSTRDDAAGEALDKGAKLLGLGYPGGPWIEKFAVQGRADAYDFPRGIGKRDELDFSFSGLKTSLRYTLEKLPTAEVQARLADLCASYQQAVIDALMRKTRAALKRRRFASFGLSGGVANNRALRIAGEALAGQLHLPLLAALPGHTGDNAGMIAFACWVDRCGVEREPGLRLTVNPGAPLAAIPESHAQA